MTTPIKLPVDEQARLYTPSHGADSSRHSNVTSATPSARFRMDSTLRPRNINAPIPPKWAISRPYLTFGYLFQPRSDGDEPKLQPLGSFPVEVQEILVG